MAQNIINELAAAKCGLKYLPELDEQKKDLVNVSFTAVEQAIVLLAANTQAKEAPCVLETTRSPGMLAPPPPSPNPNLQNLGSTKPLSPDELKKRFNALAPQAGVKTI